MLLVVAVAAALVLFTATDLVDAGQLRARVVATGAWAPLVYLLVSAVLGAALVPGPLLAGLSGVLFGPVTGTVVTVASAVLSALVAWAAGRGAGRAGMSDLLGRRAETVAGLSRRHGTGAVLAQRLAPGIPDAPLSYAFGAFELSARQVALGTVLGSLPRAFSYTAAGAALDHPGSALGIAAVVVYVLTAVAGAEIARRAMRATRRASRAEPVGDEPVVPRPPG